MNKKITVNSKDYQLKELDFNGICDLEDLGFSMADFKKSRMSGIRALLAYCGDIDEETAGEEIMEHLKKGGSLNDFAPLIEMLNSFFRSTRQQSETEETPTSEETAQP